jgi:hypothetical protein
MDALMDQIPGPESDLLILAPWLISFFLKAEEMGLQPRFTRSSYSFFTIYLYKPSNKKLKTPDITIIFDVVKIWNFPFFTQKQYCKVSFLVKNYHEIQALPFENQRKDCSFYIKEVNGEKVASEGFYTQFLPYAEELMSNTLRV